MYYCVDNNSYTDYYKILNKTNSTCRKLNVAIIFKVSTSCFYSSHIKLVRMHLL